MLYSIHCIYSSEAVHLFVVVRVNVVGISFLYIYFFGSKRRTGEICNLVSCQVFVKNLTGHLNSALCAFSCNFLPTT